MCLYDTNHTSHVVVVLLSLGDVAGDDGMPKVTRLRFMTRSNITTTTHELTVNTRCSDHDV
jgi:hypothetical protein